MPLHYYQLRLEHSAAREHPWTRLLRPGYELVYVAAKTPEQAALEYRASRPDVVVTDFRRVLSTAPVLTTTQAHALFVRAGVTP